MNKKPKIIAFAGSTRQESYNKKLNRLAAAGAEKAGAAVTMIDLRDYPLPLYDGDLEASEGIPENGLKLRQLMRDHQGLMLSCPEYNSSISAVLKYTIDWVSRPRAGEPSLACFKDKVVSLMSASPGALGGLRGLVHVRSILGNIGCLVLPDQVAISKAQEAFAETGQLLDESLQHRIEALGLQLTQILQKLDQPT
jgi:NAD(P)H-dependent FMN reductase